jgi:hypothetical protein
MAHEHGAGGGMGLEGETEMLGENSYSATLSTTNPMYSGLDSYPSRLVVCRPVTFHAITLAKQEQFKLTTSRQAK